jgi:hypothetical protein
MHLDELKSKDEALLVATAWSGAGTREQNDDYEGGDMVLDRVPWPDPHSGANLLLLCLLMIFGRV